MDLSPIAARRLSRSQRIAMLGGVADRAAPLRLQRADLLIKLMRLDEAWAELAGLADDSATLALRCRILIMRGDPASAGQAAGLMARQLAATTNIAERDQLTVRHLDLLALAGNTAALDTMWQLANRPTGLTGVALLLAISALARAGLTAERAATLLHLHRPLLLAPDAPARSYALHNALLALSGDMASAATAAGLNRFIHHLVLLPADHPLNAAAIAELKQADDLHFSGERRPGRHLQRIEQLPARGMAAVPALLQHIGLAIAAYVADLVDVPGGHRFTRTRPARARLAAWAAIAEEQGHEEWHTHDKAWLSGTYYLKVPPVLAGDAGAITFGWPGLDPVLTHQPVTGELILFPSYQHHRTSPLGGPGERIALTFDVLPA